MLKGSLSKRQAVLQERLDEIVRVRQLGHWEWAACTAGLDVKKLTLPLLAPAQVGCEFGAGLPAV